MLYGYSRIYLFFFFKQKTAYDVRISDWSSDVCSSDLIPVPGPAFAHTARDTGEVEVNEIPDIAWKDDARFAPEIELLFQAVTDQALLWQRGEIIDIGAERDDPRTSQTKGNCHAFDKSEELRIGKE